MNDFFLRYTDVQLCLNNQYINFGEVEEVLGPADYFVEFEFGIEDAGWKSLRPRMIRASCALSQFLELEKLLLLRSLTNTVLAIV